MIPDPKIFYQTYLKDYHGTKATYLKKILDDLPKYEKELFDKELDEEEKDQFRLTLKSDLRQTYFHAIETWQTKI
jgi:putative sterol carrier protein